MIKNVSSQGDTFTEHGWRGQTVFIKTPFKDDAEGHSTLLQEVEILKGLAYRRVIQFYDSEYEVVDGERRLRLIMEYAEGGALNGAITKLLWPDKERITGEIADGLVYIHSLGIIHCDIKSLNVLLTKNLEVKICDFGSARMTTGELDEKQRSMGTKGWMAPEFLEDPTAYSSESDVYSLGLVMWHMALCEDTEMFSKTPVLGEKLNDVSCEYHRVMQACWAEDPKGRPSCSDILLWSQGLSPNETSDKLAQFSIGDDNFILKSLPHISPEHEVVVLDGRTYSKAVVMHYLLSQLFRKGDGGVMNQGEADRWEYKAAEGGFPVSQNYFGNSYFRVGNYTGALKWYRKSAEQGDPVGQYWLGLMYSVGHGMSRKNHCEGKKWTRKAAAQEYIHAIAAMGHIYLIERKYSKAMEWCLKAVGERIAEYHIGLIYRYGLGLPSRDYTRAMIYFQLSARKEFALAEYAIAAMYHKGEGVRVNLRKAAKWYMRAKEHGDKDAVHELALALEDIGDIDDYHHIYNYLDEAEEQGHPLARVSIRLRRL